MKKIISVLLSLLILTSCYSYNNVNINEIDNSKTNFPSYIVTLKSGEKLYPRYIFNRESQLELYIQGQSRFYDRNDILKIEGKKNDMVKFALLLVGVGVAMTGIVAILKNNGVDAKTTYGDKK